MFKAGYIRKIQVENFVTYSYVEMYPGPNLNMIIGPNGTGKSTMVAAIILGLGGNPKTVGRGTRMAEYVKHTCNEAKIDIYLQDVQENSIIKITREFNIEDKTRWKINGQKCNASKIQDCIKQFNIQVDNLCQFLPQDRVADFAKLNKKELLKETQVALCRTDLITKQQALIDTRSKHVQLINQIEQKSKNLQDVQDINSRMEGRVQNFAKKIKFTEQIAAIERKIAWTEYESKREILSEIKKDKATAQEVYDRYRNEIQPFEREIHTYKEALSTLQQGNSKLMQSIRNHEGNINEANEKIETLTVKVREIEDDMNTKLAENDQWDRQIEEALSKLDDNKKTYETLMREANQGNDQKLVISREITNGMNQIRQFQVQREQLEQNCADGKTEMKALQHEQTRIENVKQTRLEQLKRINNDAYTAVLWLRSNRHLFKGEICEPMMLEINVYDVLKAKYIESMIPLRDRLAFTCTEKSDMNLLIRSLREQQGLSINALHSGPAPEGYNQPNIPIQNLKTYGFYTYVNTLFTAPEPIMRYLCESYRLHNIPVGDATTNNCYEKVPQQLSVFFSDRFRFAVHYSKYSGEKSSRQNLIRKDGGLSLSLDVVRLENVKGRCREIRRKVENLENQLANLNGPIQSLEEKIKSYKEKLMEVHKKKQQIDALGTKIASGQRYLKEMQNNKRSPEEIKSESRRKTKKIIQTMGLLIESLKKYFNELQRLIINCNLNSLKIETIRQKIEYMGSEITEKKGQIRDAKETLGLVTDKYNVAMQEAKDILQKAKALSKGVTPADVGFDEFRQIHDELGNDIEELNKKKEDLNSRIGCLNIADTTEMREYEDRVTQIGKLTQSIHDEKIETKKLEAKMQRLQNEWLSPLNDLLTTINLRFATSFEKLGCAGEIALCQGDDEKNYADYGIAIRVTYRSGEPLQELNTTIQSGGERAVATAAFMLALQELTPVPFRCVDEINQGMDATNERRIFKLVVETTCQADTSQYFLITPKLVPNLDYPRHLTVHIIHNGPFMNPDQKYSRSTLCNPQSNRIQ
ncbi:structural maintenance of chromosomes protein 5 [Euwallacea fornicatus]|uniref:structural maintenance of chromosomes protein 5 n=1 Tax=Euwallacea fornicatus TaxID=995702 RepID=UPI00338FE048